MIADIYTYYARRLAFFFLGWLSFLLPPGVSFIIFISLLFVFFVFHVIRIIYFFLWFLNNRFTTDRVLCRSFRSMAKI